MVAARNGPHLCVRPRREDLEGLGGCLGKPGAPAGIVAFRGGSVGSVSLPCRSQCSLSGLGNSMLSGASACAARSTPWPTAPGTCQRQPEGRASSASLALRRGSPTPRQGSPATTMQSPLPRCDLRSCAARTTTRFPAPSPLPATPSQHRRSPRPTGQSLVLCSPSPQHAAIDCLRRQRHSLSSPRVVTRRGAERHLDGAPPEARRLHVALHQFGTRYGTCRDAQPIGLRAHRPIAFRLGAVPRPSHLRSIR